jgi:hypothetical protein
LPPAPASRAPARATRAQRSAHDALAPALSANGR